MEHPPHSQGIHQHHTYAFRNDGRSGITQANEDVTLTRMVFLGILKVFIYLVATRRERESRVIPFFQFTLYFIPHDNKRQQFTTPLISHLRETHSQHTPSTLNAAERDWYTWVLYRCMRMPCPNHTTANPPILPYNTQGRLDHFTEFQRRSPCFTLYLECERDKGGANAGWHPTSQNVTSADVM